MSPRRIYQMVVCLATMVYLSSVSPAFAKSSEGKLRIHVSPRGAYVFVDGAALKEGNCTLASLLCTIHLQPGEHTVEVHNYGYKTEDRKVDIEAGKVTHLNVALTKEGGPVSPPWGRIEIKGPPHAAVLMNGTTPDYFVEHVSGTDSNIFLHHLLVVPPGQQQVDVTWWGNTIWSGTVDVKPNQTTIVDVNHGGSTSTKPWPKGGKFSSLPRYTVGLFHSTTAVAPVSGQFSASPTSVNCGDSSTLTWSSSNAVGAQISNVGNVATSGSQSVSPKQTTDYDFTASGPGGIVHQSATVNVNTAIQASLTAEPSTVRYHKRGSQVLEQGTTTLTWTTSNAQTVSIDPIGSVSPNGSQTVTPTPTQTSNGPVNEDVTYTLHAANECGGSATETATVHITGLIEPAVTSSEVEAVLTSVFFPTSRPSAHHPDDGLLASQKAELDKLAAAFVKFHNAISDSMLSLDAYADVRGPLRYNQELSERRADIVKSYLVSQGVPADAIETHAYGKTKELSLKEVRALEAQNPNKVEKMRSWYLDVLAMNRRVDIVLEPEGKRSTPYYPHNAPDVGVLYQFHEPPLRVVRAHE